MQVNKNVVIISALSEPTTDNVLNWLYLFGINPVRLNGHITFDTFSVTLNTEVKYLLNGTCLDAHTRIWYRRGNFNFDTNGIRNLGYSEIISQKHIIKSIGNINKEEDNNLSRTKALQVALRLGLKIPTTIVTNNLVHLRKGFSKYSYVPKFDAPFFWSFELRDKKVIFSYGDILISSLTDFDVSKTFMSSIFQEYIVKKYEIRSFYLNGVFKSMAIFSQENEKTKTDFRNYDYERPNRCVPYQLPKWYEKKLHNLMLKLDINCGSFDILVTPNDEYYFLEVNPIGQFQWLSKNCNYFIERLVAETLAA